MTILIQHNQYYFRKISIDVKSQGSQARMIGTVISIIGGMSMTYYKGPVVKQYSPLFLQLARPRLLVFTSTHENWVLGCFLFATASLALCAWNIIQVIYHSNLSRFFFVEKVTTYIPFVVETYTTFTLSVHKLRIDIHITCIIYIYVLQNIHNLYILWIFCVLVDRSV